MLKQRLDSSLALHALNALVAVITLAAALPSQAATVITVDAPGCTNGGTLSWNAATKSVFCNGAASQPGPLTVTGPDCAAGTAFGWSSGTQNAACQASAGATPAASLSVNVSLPDCVPGMVSWNATTKTLTCRLVSQALNIDGSTSTVYDPLTDGLLVIRYLFGMRGNSLVANAVSATATRKDAASITAHLDSIRTSLDIDNNGSVDALTDGTLILRYMFGTRGTTLVNGAIGNGAFNATPAGVAAKIQSLMP